MDTQTHKTPDFTMKDQSSKPFAWTLEGVDMEGVAWMGVAAHVEAYVRQSIDASGFAESNNLTIEDVYQEWLTLRESDEFLAFVEEAVATWQLEQIMTAPEVAEAYGIEEITVYKNIERGNLRARKAGKTLLIRRADAEARWGKKK